MDALDYPFFQRALAAGLLASLAGGIVGSFILVRRMVSITGGLAHAAFGGVGLGYFLGFSPMAGAMGFGLMAGLGVGLAHRRLSSGLDTLIAMAWAVGMALGMFFISLTPGYAPDLTSYLFGSLLLAPTGYLYLMAAVDLIVIAVVALLFNDLRAVAFDEEFSEVVGRPVEPLFLILLGLISLVVVTLIQVVGVILVIALLSIPAALARQWSESLQRTMVLATIVSAVCITAGLFLSYWLDSVFGLSVPTGPLIILLAAGTYIASSSARRRIRHTPEAWTREDHP